MQRPVLQWLFTIALGASALVTCFLGARLLLAPEAMMHGFGVDSGVLEFEGFALLQAVLGSAIASLGLIVLLAAWWAFQGRRAGRTLGMWCAATLLLVAACAFLIAGSTQVLLLDGLRGSVLLVLGALWKPVPS